MANEKRLIDAVRFRETLDRYANAPHVTMTHSTLSKVMRMAIDTCIELLDMQRAVDAVEVVHAYWTGSRFNPMTDEYEEYCSHCCAWSSEYGKPYCPNCGAKMDGGNEDA